ncbi:hypothetical protein PBRA_004818 [Plasmodiophora brassicae]|uniref:Uncharacterized protein n=1 Tax=Plasmodiophora brassicae TaxID=37360 RepID=A0A0G4ILS2_PLABS|nr:hypothetical protein PBRA_004818 [Plasmodiophora brassicae]
MDASKTSISGNGAAAPEAFAAEADASADHLHLRSNEAFRRFLVSIDHADEAVLYSNRVAVLRPDSADAHEDMLVCITNYRLLLCPPMIDNVIICTDVEQCPLEDVILVSLPYRSTAGDSLAEVALRTDDCALHLISFATVWLRIPAEHGRSQFVETLFDAYERLVADQLPIQQIDYDELLAQIQNGDLHEQIVGSRQVQWAHQPLLRTGTFLYQAIRLGRSASMPTHIDVSKFESRFFSVSRHSLYVFRSEKEMTECRAVLRKPQSARTRLPQWHEVDLSDSLMSTFRLAHGSTGDREGIQLFCQTSSVHHLILPEATDTDPSRTVERWATTIKNRDLEFLRKIRELRSSIQRQREVGANSDNGVIEVHVGQRRHSTGRNPGGHHSQRSIPETQDMFEDVPLEETLDKLGANPPSLTTSLAMIH